MKVFKCKDKERGFIANKQDYRSIFVTYTQNIDEAKTYKTKQGAARALNFRKWDSEVAKERLEFFEFEVTESMVAVV